MHGSEKWFPEFVETEQPDWEHFNESFLECP